MTTASELIQQIEAYLQGTLNRQQLAVWAENALLDGVYEEAFFDTIADALARIGASDVQGFELSRETLQNIIHTLQKRNNTKPDVIIELEKELDVVFEQVNIEEIKISRFGNVTTKYALDEQKNVIGLSIQDKTITEIPTVIAEMSYLTHLNLHRNKITDIFLLDKLSTHLSFLNLGDNNITDVSVLKKFEDISFLSLYKNKIIDISPLQKLTKLISLNLFSNQIVDIQHIKNLTNLQVVDLSNNNINDLSVLAKLKQLKGLRLLGNSITDISPLKELTQLVELFLSGNQIQNISILKYLKNLISINLIDIPITDLSLFSELKNIQYLSLENNQITDLSPIKHFFDKEDFKFKTLKNPIQTPPLKIAQRGSEVIKNWFFTDGCKGFINTLSIQNYFSIKNVSFNNLSNKKEIYLLGENGVGKTILLQAITMCLRGEFKNENILKQLLENKLFIETEKNETEKQMQEKAIFSCIATDSDNITYEFTYPETNTRNAKTNIFAYGVNRSKGVEESIDDIGSLTLFADVGLTKPQNFLKEIERLQFKNIGKLTLNTVIEVLTQVINFEEGKKDVEIQQDAQGEFYFVERGTRLKFGQLSDGYKNALLWMCDLLSRLAKDQPTVTDTRNYKAIVLVDEIDLFLHPRWAYKLMSRLRVLFPNIQWFITTHSPIVTLGASEDAVFYKVYKNEQGETEVSRPFDKIAGFTANSLLTSNLWLLPNIITQNTLLRQISDDDYVYKLIHDQIYERMKNNPAMQQDDILKLIDLELNKISHAQ